MTETENRSNIIMQTWSEIAAECNADDTTVKDQSLDELQGMPDLDHELHIPPRLGRTTMAKMSKKTSQTIRYFSWMLWKLGTLLEDLAYIGDEPTVEAQNPAAPAGPTVVDWERIRHRAYVLHT